jgi:hypothetical protein
LASSAATDDENQFIDAFPPGSPWGELWGTGIQQDDQDRDFAAIRTQFVWAVSKGEYVTERKFLLEWPVNISDASRAAQVERIPPVSVVQSTPISLYLLDAKRDGADDIRSRSSSTVDNCRDNLNHACMVFPRGETVERTRQ